MRLDGIDLAEYLPEERLGIGMVRSFQDCRLYPELTVLDVLLLCEDARQEVAVLPTTLRLPWARRAERRKLEAVDQVIAAFGLERFRHHRTAELSTGTRRVVDLASIVLAQPRLLLLDEPTAGIAQREAEAFIPLLRRLHAGGRHDHRPGRARRARSSSSCARRSWSWSWAGWWPPGRPR